MAQVNVAYDDIQIAHADRIAVEEGMSRPDFLRTILDEAIAAREQGRPMFDPPPPPISLDSAIHLATKVEHLCINLDRQNRSWDKREKKLIDTFNLSEDTRRKSEKGHGRELIDLFREGTTPFATKLTQFHDEMVAMQNKLLAATQEPGSLKAIRADLGKIAAASRRSRREHHFHLGETWKLTGLQTAVCGFLALVAVGIFQTWLASVLPSDWLASKLTLKMYGSADVAICELYEYSRHVEHCPVLAPKETAGDR